MDTFKAVYVEKCRDFLCEPVKPLLTAMETALEKNVVLSTIKLNGNSKELFNKRVEYMQVFALAEALHDYQYVTHLNLSYNNIDDAGVATIARLLKFNHSLREVDLEGNNIGPDGATKLAEAISGGAGLQILNLNFNPIGEGGGEAMARMVAGNTSLQVLDLGNTSLGMRSLVGLATALNEQNSTLLYLNVENPILWSVQEEATLHFSRMLASNTSLRHLRLGKHSLRDHGCLTMVSYGLVNNSALTTLDLRCNALSEEAAAPLARLLTDNNTVTTLVLASNRLKDNGAATLAQALPHNHTLTHLDLSYNSLEEKGLLALAEALKFNNALTSIRLWGNVFCPLSSRAWCDLFEDMFSKGHGVDCDFRPYQVDDKIYVAKVDYEGPTKIPWAHVLQHPDPIPQSEY